MTPQPYSIETHSGTQLTWGSFNPEAIRIDDIAHALSLQCRYNGHCTAFYSVAEHSVLVARWLKEHNHAPRIQLLGLLHDAAEAYIGDIITPVKDAIPQIRELEATVAASVYAGLHVKPPTPRERTHVKRADEILLATEAHTLMPSRGANWGLTQKPDLGIRITCFTPEAARVRFRRQFIDLTTGYCEHTPQTQGPQRINTNTRTKQKRARTE